MTLRKGPLGSEKKGSIRPNHFLDIFPESTKKGGLKKNDLNTNAAGKS